MLAFLFIPKVRKVVLCDSLIMHVHMHTLCLDGVAL